MTRHSFHASSDAAKRRNRRLACPDPAASRFPKKAMRRRTPLASESDSSARSWQTGDAMPLMKSLDTPFLATHDSGFPRHGAKGILHRPPGTRVMVGPDRQAVHHPRCRNNDPLRELATEMQTRIADRPRLDFLATLHENPMEPANNPTALDEAGGNSINRSASVWR